MRALALALMTAAALTAAPASQAATLSSSGGTLTLTASDGEANFVSVGYFADTNEYVVNDEIAISGAPPGCRVDSTRATCPAAGITAVQAQLGDANDHFDAGVEIPVPVTVDGGLGDDDINSVGSSTGGEGNDTMRPGGRAGDVVDGGPGNDELLGTRQAETLDGGPGDDRISGEGGADTLIGGEGTDRIRGSTSATVDCQGRDDEVLSAGSRVKLANCISAAPAFRVAVTRVNPRRLANRGMPFTVTCDRACAVSWKLAPDKRVLAMLHHCCLLDGIGVQRDDDSFPIFATAPQKFVAGVHGLASQKVVRRQRSMTATLTVEVSGRTGPKAQHVLKLKLS